MKKYILTVFDGRKHGIREKSWIPFLKTLNAFITFSKTNNVLTELLPQMSSFLRLYFTTWLSWSDLMSLYHYYSFGNFGPLAHYGALFFLSWCFKNT